MVDSQSSSQSGAVAGPRVVPRSVVQRGAESSGSSCAYQPVIDELRQRLNRTLQGKSNVVEMVLACLLARGHLLLEDLPGLGKTTLAKSLARCIQGNFARVQCTPDLLPSDITGFNIFNQQTREFEFREGPVFTHVLLADEINRATPRAQSALFEAMAERQVTVDRICYPLPTTFFVIATQNPVDSQGAYALPEAQLDRFALKLSIGYPDPQSELAMLAGDIGNVSHQPADPEAALSPVQLEDLQRHVAGVYVGRHVQQYLVDLAAATRQHRLVAWGLSPRGLLTWQRVAQARAHLAGRDFVTPDDIQDVASAVLSVRLTSDQAQIEQVVGEVLGQIRVPTSA